MEQKGNHVENAENISVKQKRKQDALELAQLVYDMYKEEQLTKSVANKAEDSNE